MCTYNSIAHKDSSVCLLSVCVCRCALCLYLTLSLSVERSSSFGSFLSPECNRNETIHPFPLSLSIRLIVYPATTNTIDRSLFSPSLSVLCLLPIVSLSLRLVHLPLLPSFSLPRVQPFSLSLLTLLSFPSQRINRSYLS